MKLKKSAKQKLILGFLLTVLSISFIFTYLTPSAQAMTLSNKDKGLLVLNTVLGLNITQYSFSAKVISTDSVSNLGVLPQEKIQYELISSTNVMKVLCTFVDDKLEILHVLENRGIPSLMGEDRNSDNVYMARAFLQKYDLFYKCSLHSVDSPYGKLTSSLEVIDKDKNISKIIDDAQLDVNSIGASQTFKWTYTSNGAIAPSKVIALSYENGFLKYFVDRWNFYNIADVNASLSKEEAIEIALQTARSYKWSVKLDTSSLSAENFNMSNVCWTSVLLDDSIDASSARNKNLLVLYPVWRVGIALDKWYDHLYGIEVDIWADNGEVRFIQEAWSTSPPPEGVPTAAINESLPEPNFAMVVGAPTLFIMCLAGLVFWAYKNRQTCLYRIKPRVLKTSGILLCLLISSTIIFGAIESVNASTRSSVVWGSESYGAGYYPDSWRKSSTEIELQRTAAIAITSYFSNFGFTAVNHQQNLGSTKTQILSDISYYQNNYNYLAVVDFDHGVIGQPSTQIAPPSEPHYMFEDTRGTYYDGNWHQESGVYDMEIYPLIQSGNKIFFHFMSTCKSADTTGQAMYPAHFPTYGERAYTLPFGWTHRFVIPLSDPNFNVQNHMSDDGYRYPDSGSQVYIGFPLGSASLMQNIPYEDGTEGFFNWVLRFFEDALYDDLSVNQALNQASLETWSCDFGSSPLQQGFTAYWWGLPTQGDCTLAVYGNGNVFLRYYEPDHVGRPILGGPDTGYINTAYQFSAYSVDSCNHNIQYTFDWGDGTQPTVTGWYSSGQIATATHSWSTEDVYDVKVKAQCTNGVWSDWSSVHDMNIGNFPLLTVEANHYSQGQQMWVPLWIDSNYVGTTPYSNCVSPTSHQIYVEPDLYFYYFLWYSYDGIDDPNNPLTLSIMSDKTIMAWYD